MTPADAPPRSPSPRVEAGEGVTVPNVGSGIVTPGKRPGADGISSDSRPSVRLGTRGKCRVSPPSDHNRLSH
jgi:hypothetical protein